MKGGTLWLLKKREIRGTICMVDCLRWRIRFSRIALQLAKENRGTTASRLMQRFADRPFSTWKNIEEALKPYKDRIRCKVSRPA